MENQPQEAKRNIEPLSFSEELARAVIDSLSAHIAILDKNGVILETNRAWNTYSFKNGMPEDFDYRGINYLKVCDDATGEDASDAHNIAKGIRRVIQGDTKEFLFDYPCHFQDSRHWYYMRAIINFGIVAEIRPFDILCSKDISEK